MFTNKPILRIVTKTLLWVVFTLLVLLALQITVLAFPEILVRNGSEYGTIALYYDREPNDELDRMAKSIDERLRGSRFYDSTRTDNVYLIRSEGLYNYFVKVSMLGVTPQGFNLSIFGNSYVSMSRVAALGEGSGGKPPYSIWEGDPVHTAAHEVGHQYIIDRIGRDIWKSLPHWKREGLPEYVSNIGAIRKDSTATLLDRVAVLQSDRAWGATRNWQKQDWNRIHYEAGLLVEFLFDVEGLELDEIIADVVTKSGTRTAMLEWADRQRAVSVEPAQSR